MPIYEYACGPCGAVFEELILRSSDEEELACPTCCSDRVSRLMSRPASTRTASEGGSGGPPPPCGPVG